jgi:hypothetical protein
MPESLSARSPISARLQISALDSAFLVAKMTNCENHSNSSGWLILLLRHILKAYAVITLELA